MNPRLSPAAAVALVAAGAAGIWWLLKAKMPTEPNLITDPGFEAGAGGWQPWPGSGATVEQSAEHAASGKYSLKLTTIAANGSAYCELAEWPTGVAVSFSALVYKGAGSPSPTVAVFWHDASGWHSVWTDAAQDAGGGWARHTVSRWAIPDGTTAIELVLLNADIGVTYWDDVRLTVVS